jgi:flavin-dependent dehydrogenase
MPKATFQRGIAIEAKYTLVAEGARGSLAKGLIADFHLDADSEPQKFGIGIKEVWEVAPALHRPGFVLHTLGWPLDNRTGGGSFLYHLHPNLIAVGLVVHLNYRNPHLPPSRNTSASRPTLRSRPSLPAPSASPTVPARSPKAAGSRCPSSRFLAVRSSAARRAS